MAERGLKALEDTLKADESLRLRYEEALKGVTDAASDGEAIQKAAAQLGFEVSLEELEQAWAADQDLDDAELENLAGGVDLDDQWCLWNFHCYVTTRHEEVKTKKHNEACWSDYYCAIVYEH